MKQLFVRIGFIKPVVALLLLSFTNCAQENQNKELLMENNGKSPNKLVNEQSPYLQQHAYNPVDWFPWGEEAFEKAVEENKPIFLSIGYSTCHWCHVMEHESFEDEEVAKLMNEYFISIKVDREERPDIDNIYMSVCQLLTGRGGWPLTIIMTPDKKPFFAGTYFPKNTVMNRIGMTELIPKIVELWKNEPQKIFDSAENITSHLINTVESKSKGKLETSVLQTAYNNFSLRYDPKYGGFGSAPKFPSSHNHLFLMSYWKEAGEDKALDMVKTTLTEMSKGGIYDHIGFGFHRYSTDQEWLVPHFEKMLYDQAMLVLAFTELYQITNENSYKRTAEEILSYVSRDMTSEEGGFYSAEDADSEGIEGKFYVWNENEIDEILSKKEGLIFKKVFNITSDGNFLEESTRSKTGNNIPNVSESFEDLSGQLNIETTEVIESVNKSRQKLFAVREKRVHPLKDTKILTDWNGLMITAFTRAGRIFNNKSYIEIAENAYKFVLQKLGETDGSLLHRYKDGESSINGFLDDYSFMIQASLELYESTFTTDYLEKAIELNAVLIDNFWDKKNFGFYFTSDSSEELLARSKDFYDGAIPSGNSIALTNLIKLGKITADSHYEDYANKLVSIFANEVKSNPNAYSQILSGFQFLTGESFEVLIVGDPDSNESEKILDKLNSLYIPNKVVLFISDGDRERLNKIAPYTSNYEKVDNKTTVYVCRNYTCSLPTNDVDEMEKLLLGK